jgi:hypothetical protein
MNVRTAWEDRSDDVKDCFYEALRRVLSSFIDTTWNFFWGDFNEKVGGKDILKPTIRNESSHEISDDTGATEINFVTSKTNCEKYNVPSSQ